MIRAEDEAFVRQLLEGSRDVGSSETWTIGADDDDLIVAEAGEFFGRGFEALGEVRADLLVHYAVVEAGQFSRAKKMKVREPRSLRETTPGEEGTEESRQPTPSEIETGRVSEDEDGFSIHAFRSDMSAGYSPADAKRREFSRGFSDTPGESACSGRADLFSSPA